MAVVVRGEAIIGDSENSSSDSKCTTAFAAVGVQSSYQTAPPRYCCCCCAALGPAEPVEPRLHLHTVACCLPCRAGL